MKAIFWSTLLHIGSNVSYLLLSNLKIFTYESYFRVKTRFCTANEYHEQYIYKYSLSVMILTGMPEMEEGPMIGMQDEDGNMMMRRVVEEEKQRVSRGVSTIEIGGTKSIAKCYNYRVSLAQTLFTF